MFLAALWLATTLAVAIWGMMDRASTGYVGIHLGKFEGKDGQGWEVREVFEGSPADRAGVQKGWRLVRVDGEMLDALSLREFPETLPTREKLEQWGERQAWLRSHTEPGSDVALVFVADGVRHEVTLTAVTVPAWLVLKPSLIYLIAGTVFLLLGMIVVKRRPGSEAGQLLLVFCALFQAFLFTQPLTEAPRTLAQSWATSEFFFDLSDVLQLLSATAIVTFCGTFAGVWKKGWWMAAAYGLAAVIWAVYRSRVLGAAPLVAVPAYYLVAVGMLVWGYRNTGRAPDRRKQMKWLLWGGGVPVATLLLVWSMDFLLYTPVSRSDTSQIMGISTLAFPVATVLAILRHRLFDIDLIVRRSLIAAVALPLLGIGYSWIAKSVGGALVPDHPPLLLMVAIMFLVLFLPGQVRVEESLDRILGRNRYAARRKLQDTAAELADIDDVEPAAERVVETLVETMELRSGAVCLADVDEERLAPFVAGQWERTPEPLPFQFLEKLPRECRAVFVDAHFGPETPSELGAPLPVVLVPLAAGPRVLGFVSVGQRHTGSSWDRGDLEALELVARSFALAVDRTYHHVLLRKVRDMQAQIVHQGRLAALGTLAAGVAHELNTPLGYVRSNAQVLRHLVKPGLDEDRAEDVAELVGDIEEGANQMAQVVSNLRTFTQVDSQGAQLVSLNDSVRRSLEMLKGSQPAGVEMETSLSQIPEVEGYPAQLNQMVVNLVTNAWDACDGKGEIEVLTATEGDRVVFSVIDSGPGISEDVADRLFDPFFSTKTVGKNMGLGLSITRSIVEAHGGEITVANRSDGAEGAEARVSLPLGGRS